MGVLTFQAGEESLKIARDVRTGITTAQAKCWAPDVDTAYNAPCLDIGIPIPEYNPRQISRRVAGEKGGYDVLVNYEGHPDPANAGEYFELEGSSTEDPIETHWNYAVLLKNYQGREDANGKATWPKMLSQENGTSLTGRNKMHGVTSWPACKVIWNHNFVVTGDFPDDILQELNCITKNPPGKPPYASAGRDWLCIRITGRQRGNVWQIKTSFELSGPYGSVPEMYEQI